MKRSIYTRYIVTFCLLVIAVLMINASLLLYLTYRERFGDAADLQKDKAQEVALRIEYTLRSIENQVRWVTATRWASQPSAIRRLDYLRLMRQVPAISGLTQLDRSGREKLQISRLSADIIDSDADRSADPLFQAVMDKQVAFGQPESPKGGDSSLSMAVAHDGLSSVTVADISLGRVLDFISRFRAEGQTYLYVTDDRGRLLAKSDTAPSLPASGLTDTKLLEVAKAAEPMQPGSFETVNIQRAEVLSAFVFLPLLNWFVFVERPIGEVRQPIIAFIQTSALLSLLCVGLAAIVAAALAYRAVLPLRALQEGARRMEAGDLGHRISISTGDELEELAGQLNVSAAALQKSRDGLERQVEERTGELREALQVHLAAGEILQIISRSEGDVRPALDSIVTAACKFCGAPDAAIALRDGDEILRAAHDGPLEAHVGMRDPLNRASATGRAIIDAKTVEIPDVLRYEGDLALGKSMARQMGFRSLLAAPMIYRGSAIGCVLLRRPEPGAFTARQTSLLERFAAQAVVAVRNATLMTELKRRENELRVTFDHMADGVAMFDADLRLVSWNRNFQDLLRIPSDFLTERPTMADYVAFLARQGELGGDNAALAEERYRRNMDESWSIETLFPDGRVLEARNTPVPGGGAVLIYSDITERKKAEAEIHSARDAAEAALDKLKAAQANLVQSEKMASLGQLTAGIAHEIKNPLNFVNNFAGLSVDLLDEFKELASAALDTLDDGRRAEIDETIALLTGNLAKIAEHGKRADGIVRSMLSHSRGGAGDWQASNINILVDEALNLAYHGARASNKQFNATLERDLAASATGMDVVPQDITRVLLNLFGNGFYALNKRRQEDPPAGYAPTLSVSTRDAGDWVEIRVRDNGTGIAPDVAARLFEPFFTTKPTGEGTGLGLSISYDIVTQQHGGTLNVESEPGAFTEFTVRLPRARRGGRKETGQ